MSSLSQRMRWRPGDASPPLDLKDVLVMLRVDDRPEREQRKAVDDALARGDIGPPSLAALHAAGWVETSGVRRFRDLVFAAPRVVFQLALALALLASNVSGILVAGATLLLVMAIVDALVLGGARPEYRARSRR